MNFTESFEQFSSRLSTMDLALYAGIGLVLWVLFKDRLSPVQKLVLDLVNGFKNTVVTKPNVVAPVVIGPVMTKADEDVFFQLVASWKQTRDLAVKSGCSEAVKVADQMFPHLSPMVCKQETVTVAKDASK